MCRNSSCWRSYDHTVDRWLFRAGGSAGNLVEIGKPYINVITGAESRFNNVKVLGARATGGGAPTGTATRTTFATNSITLPQFAERVKALIDDLTTHGVIGA